MEGMKLNFINFAEAGHTMDIVICQKNEAEADGLTNVTAWQVIKHCNFDHIHPFLYSKDLEFSIVDVYGNHTRRIFAAAGFLYRIQQIAGRVTISHDGPASKPGCIEFFNDNEQGALSIHIYRSGSLLYQRNQLYPQEYTLVKFNDVLLMARINGIDESKIIPDNILPRITSYIHLPDVDSGNIIMTGGGAPETAKPFSFTFQQ